MMDSVQLVYIHRHILCYLYTFSLYLHYVSCLFNLFFSYRGELFCMFCFRSCYFSLCPSCISYLFDLFALLLLYISTFAFVCLCLDLMPVPFSSPQDQDQLFYDLLVLLLVCLLLLYFAYFCCLLLILFCHC